MARARNKWKSFSFKKLKTLADAVQTEVGQNKVVGVLAAHLGQGNTAVRGYLARRMVPNSAAQDKLNELFNLMLTNKPLPKTEEAKTKVKKMDSSAPNVPPQEPTPPTNKEVLVPLSLLRRVVNKMPVTSKELDVLEAMLTR